MQRFIKDLLKNLHCTKNEVSSFLAYLHTFTEEILHGKLYFCVQCYDATGTTVTP